MFPVKVIADYYIWKSAKENKPITNKKLQKLLYYAQAWHLVFYKKPLFKEDIEAWIHGPTVRSVYFSLKKFGFAPIKKDVDKKIIKQLKDQIPVLEGVWDVYGKFDADYLEELTHSEEPWQKTRSGLELHIASNNVISPNLMRKYYLMKLNKARAKKDAANS